jgi:hypothetical protein
LAEKIIVLGGYGVFGGRLARRLVHETDAEILVAGRAAGKAEAHCRAHGGRPLAMDRDKDLAAVLAAEKPAIVIDAAGPFQAYGADPWRVARAAIAAGCHYLDLADDAAFVAGIDRLDREAAAAGVCVISGASSIPAISAAALDELVRGLAHVSLVGSAILPGNRAPRGLSVVRAIVGQAGRPLRVRRGGRWETAKAWGDLERFSLAADGAAPLPPRLASLIGAPDLLLFPERYRARSVLFHAGLELKLMHLGLWLLAWPVRLGIARSIAPLAGALKRIADLLEPFGSDRGGMVAYAVGRDQAGRAVERRWTLIAEAGDGPEVPPTPALLLANALLGGQRLAPGARPAAGALTLAAIEAGLGPFRIAFGRSERPAPPLMERVLPADFAALPAAWRRLAEIHDVDHFDGEASVERGSGLAARLVATLFGFPAATPSIAVSVRKEKTAAGEDWTRRFGKKSFVSHLSRRDGDEPGVLHERFGPFSFRLRLRADNGRVEWPVEGWRLLGVPMPRLLMPKSATSESVGADGRFRFDVGISVPLVGPVIRYRGWLVPSTGDADARPDRQVSPSNSTVDR